MLRLLGLTNITLGGDFAYHWSVAGSIVQGKNLPFLGPGASINQSFHLGPFYYYLLAIPYFLGVNNYKIAIIFFSLLSSLSIILLFKLSRKWFGETQSLKIAALYAFSSYMISIGNFPWNAYLVPLMVILCLYFLVKIKEGKLYYIVPLTLTFTLALQSHATTILLAPFILLQIPFRKIKLGVCTLSLILFVLLSLPWFVAELDQNFGQIHELSSTLLSQNTEMCNFGEWLSNHGHGERCFHYFRNTLFIFRLFSMSLFANTDFALAIFIAVLSLYTLITTKSKQKKLFILWLSTVFFFYLFYSANIYLHYMLILIPLPYFIFILFLEKIEKLSYGKLLSKIIFILVVINNLVSFLISLGISRS